MKSHGNRVLPIALAVFLGCSVAACAQPRLKSSAPHSYQVGEQVMPETTVFTKDLEPRTLQQILEPGTQVVVLILFGGGAPTAPDYHPLRAGIWCPDSFDELPIYRALMRYFKDAPVQFIPVAVPPAYSDIFGFKKDVFISKADDDPEFLEQVKTFIRLTEQTRETNVLPFKQLYYDPKFRLAYDSSRKMGENYGPIFDWQGKFRWDRDPRKYTTPSVWLLDSHLRLLREPFFGNDYNDDPPQVLYGFSDLKESIEGFLSQQ